MLEDGVEGFGSAEMHGQFVEAEHMARYWWATAFCQGRRVLDVGCGVGYGAGLLKRAGATEVVTIHQSQAVVEVARQGVPDGVICEVADVRSLPYKDDFFDLIVCFETIEHALERNLALDQLARVLRPDGLLLMSSPNRFHYGPGNSNRHHEYGPSQLGAALESRFPAVRSVSQYAMLASVVGLPGELSLNGARVKRLVEPGDEDEICTLAMAGNELPVCPPTVALTQFLEIRQWLERFQAQERVLKEQATELQGLEALRRERLETLELLAQREQALAEMPALRERLTAAEEELDPLREKALDLQGRLEEMTRAAKVVDSMRTSMSWRITKPLRWLKRLRR
jgi:SAM-dependent methyltransferase